MWIEFQITLLKTKFCVKITIGNFWGKWQYICIILGLTVIGIKRVTMLRPYNTFDVSSVKTLYTRTI